MSDPQGVVEGKVNDVSRIFAELVQVLGPILGAPFDRLFELMRSFAKATLITIGVLFVCALGFGAYAWSTWDTARGVIIAFAMIWLIRKFSPFLAGICAMIVGLGLAWMFLMFFVPAYLGIEMPEFPVAARSAITWLQVNRPWTIILGDDRSRPMPSITPSSTATPIPTPTPVACSVVTIFNAKVEDLVKPGSQAQFTLPAESYFVCVPPGRTAIFKVGGKSYMYTSGGLSVLDKAIVGSKVDLELR